MSCLSRLQDRTAPPPSWHLGDPPHLLSISSICSNLCCLLHSLQGLSPTQHPWSPPPHPITNHQGTWKIGEFSGKDWIQTEILQHTQTHLWKHLKGGYFKSDPGTGAPLSSQLWGQIRHLKLPLGSLAIASAPRALRHP